MPVATGKAFIPLLQGGGGDYLCPAFFANYTVHLCHVGPTAPKIERLNMPYYWLFWE